MEYLLKSQEDRFQSLVEGIEKKQAKRLVAHSKRFNYAIQKHRDVAKERYDIFVEQVTKMKEYVELKVVELKSKMSKEVPKMEQNYTFLHGKVDVIVISITKLVESNNRYLNKIEWKSQKDSQVFEKMEEFLSSIKESISKDAISNQSTISQDSISQLI